MLTRSCPNCDLKVSTSTPRRSRGADSPLRKGKSGDLQLFENEDQVVSEPLFLVGREGNAIFSCDRRVKDELCAVSGLTKTIRGFLPFGVLVSF